MKGKTSKSSSVEKALDILDCLNNKDRFLTLNEISAKTGYSKTTVFRMVSSLESYGYLKKDTKYKESRYSLGWVFLEKANLIVRQLNIPEIARNDLIRLRNETELTVQLALREGKDAVFIDQIESLKPIRIYPQVGKKAPLYSAACPRVLLAYLSENEQHDILKNIDLQAYTTNTLTNISDIEAELVKIRKNGIAVSKGELHEGTIEVASPIFESQEDVIAGVSIIGLESDFKKDKLEECTQAVKQTAKMISHKFQQHQST